ncbi:transmembrane amino acid transporter protein domain-containing protein [Ditylenchus destructor]|uniref:Transmembrane amino acid transporter protein domain-containing protein n=1 Tax=Ditylenchus destructor TaxID=166010 RepID=A0AAD4NKN1_9BILA|nr:transmembrane amino acid transporter protein domain-containing protein [Ditylenchus destructor]
MVTSNQNVPNSGRFDRAETESGMSASTEITRMSVDPLISSENLFGERQRKTTSISPEQALIHLIKVMMGTGMLSLPLAFRYSGLWLGMFLLVIICVICTYCCRVLVHASQYLCTRKGQEAMDYANVMRNAVELGPPWIRRRGYFAKQLVNSSMFIAQLGFCCIYFVFMADNLKQFFDETSNIKISQAGWIALLLVPTMALCTIRQLKVLAPLALIANVVYVAAVGIIITYLVTNLNPVSSVPAVGDYRDLPLFFGTVIFAFEGIAVVLPIENQMNEPQHFISSNGVLNTACILVLAVYCTTGFYGYLAFGNQVKDTITLNLPPTAFFQVIKIMLVGCILISYPLQFYVPMERIEKWISRKIAPEKQNLLVYSLRYTLVIVTCLGAELIPHLALFISLIGAFAGSALALLFPPIIDLLCAYSQRKLTQRKWALNIFLLIFGIFGFITGTYASLVQIMEAFGKSDV